MSTPVPPATRFGVVVPSQGPFGDPGAILDTVQAAEDLGFDSVWFGDHIVVPGYATALTPPNWFDALGCCLVGLGATRRLRFGTDVLVAPYRNPILLAKQLSSADQLSGGRLTLGVGVGFLRGEFEALAAPTFAQRGAVTDEYLAVLRLLLAASPEESLSFSGQHVSFDDIHFGPPPGQVPFPIWVGGNGRRAQVRAASLGTGWHPLFPTPEQYRDGRDHIVGLRGSAEGFSFSFSCPHTGVVTDTAVRSLSYADVGQLPDDYLYAPPMPTASDGRLRFVGTPEEIATDIELYEGSGVEHFVLRFWTVAPEVTVARLLVEMERFMTDVIRARTSRGPAPA